MFSLHATGCARLVFRSLDCTPLFEGVLITDDDEDTLGIIGHLNKKTEDDNRFLVDVNVTDGETGQLYIIRRVQLRLNVPNQSEANSLTEEDSSMEKAGDEHMAVDAGITPVVLENIPHYSLRSEVLQYTTEEILVGNRADKDISEYLNPSLLGQKLSVYVGRMSIHLSAAVTPPPTPSLEEKRRNSFSVCDETGKECLDSDTAPSTDADVNFLM